MLDHHKKMKYIVLALESAIGFGLLLLSGCKTSPPRKFPYGQPLSKTVSVAEAGVLLKERFSAFSEFTLLEAVEYKGEGRSSGLSINVEKRKIIADVMLRVAQRRYYDWAETTKQALGPLSSDYIQSIKRGERLRGNVISVDGWAFTMPRAPMDWAPILSSSLAYLPEKANVRVCLVDDEGCTVAEKIVSTSDFPANPLSNFCSLSPAVLSVPFEQLTLTQLTRARSVLCTVGNDATFVLAAARQSSNYRARHPDATISLPQGVTLSYARLSPYLGIGIYEVTQEQWESVMGRNRNPSWNRENPKNPVENVSWKDCQEFFRKVNDLPEVREAGVRLRLPTLDEWRFACRAGSSGAYGLLSDETELKLEEIGWYAGNAGNVTHPVGLKQHNAFGLYDMHGNVAEWCADSTFWSRFCLGGNFSDDAGNCRFHSKVRTSARILFGILAPEGASGTIGFRVAVAPADKP